MNRRVHIDIDFDMPGDGDWRDDPLFDQIADLVHARDDLDNQMVGGSLTDGTCGLCRGHATGLASIDDERFCHGDDDPTPTCYEVAHWRMSRLDRPKYAEPFAAYLSAHTGPRPNRSDA